VEHCTHAADVRRNTKSQSWRQEYENAVAAAAAGPDKDSTWQVTPAEAEAVAVAEIVAVAEVRPEVELWPVEQPGLELVREVAQGDSAKLLVMNLTEAVVAVAREPPVARDSAEEFFAGSGPE
jgi:hypothetical protein